MIDWREMCRAEDFLSSDEANLRADLQEWLSDKRDSHKFLAGLSVLLDMQRAVILNRYLKSDVPIDPVHLHIRLEQLRKTRDLFESLLPNDRKGAYDHERRLRIAVN